MSRYDLKKSAHDEGASREKPAQGFYTFQITNFYEKNKEGQYLETKNGDPKVLVVCEVVDDDSEVGKSLAHSVIFYRPTSPSIKGIGMTRHFLKCIGEAWEGDLSADPENWIGKRFKAEVVHNEGYANLVEIQESEQNIDLPPVKATDDVKWE